jgi:spermidine synthase
VRRALVAAVAYANLLSLAAQVVWVRKINLLFGATAGVFASVLAVVLLGLACGAAWGGRQAAVARRPERWLAGLLAGLGVIGLTLPLLDVARALVPALTADGVPPTVRLAARLPIVVLVLFPPTFTIGAVMPLATKLYGRGGAVSTLYAADTLGAATGALLGGFVLVPWLGLRVALWVLGAGALVVAALVMLSGPPAAPAPSTPVATRGRRPTRPPAVAPLDRRARQAILASLFMTGAAALLLETGWNRFFYLLNGTNIFSLSVVLAGFLTGIGLGSAAIRRRLERGGDVTVLVAFLQTIVALGGLLVFRCRELFERTYLALYQSTESYVLFQLGVYLVVFALVAVATLAMGASFPAVVRLLAPGRDDDARTLGRVYFVNTVGAVVGALAGELLILPRLGFDGLLATVVVIYLGSAALFWWLGPPAGRRRTALGLAGLAAAALVLTPPFWPLDPPWNAVYYSGVRQGTYAKYAALNAAHTVVFQRQGFYGQVTVTRTRQSLYLKHNGKTDASTDASDSYAQYLLAHVPLALHPKPERVVNIGLGGGITLGAITAHAVPREIVQVELDPLVIQAAGLWFADPNRRALSDPRVRVVVDDGRSFIERGTDTFDVIVSEPPNMWVSGVSGLFTAEFYRAARARLRPGGILGQWLPLYELTEGDFAVAMATIGAHFPHLAGWTNGSVAIIAASSDPLPVGAAFRLGDVSGAVAADFGRVKVPETQIEAFLSRPDLDAAAIARLRSSARDLNRDDRPVLEFRAARNLFYLTRPGADKDWRTRLSAPRN